LFTTITNCVVNQSNDHWLLSGGSNFATSISLLKRKKIKISSTVKHFMNNDSRVAFELTLLVSNIKKELCGMLNFFLPFLRKYEKRRSSPHVF